MVWKVIQTPFNTHVAPEGDIRPHDFTDPCWCGTRVDTENCNVIIHKAFLPLGCADEEDDEISSDPPMTEH